MPKKRQLQRHKLNWECIKAVGGLTGLVTLGIPFY